MKLTYRPEIDGLRAIAVLSVVAYHAHLPYITGGFAGVDVFFVLSGFLISSILLGDLERGAPDLITTFYERRIRRIFPPLLMMFGLTWAAGYLILLPTEFRAFARSLIYATLFGSNVGFYREAGYFDVASDTKPLLHTWSLSVEEQFYVVFPLVLIVCFRISQRALPYVVAALLIASFWLSTRAMAEQPSAAFYLPHLRAWELLAGVMTAFAVRSKPVLNALATPMSAVGVALVLYTMFALKAGMPFPGWWALAPTLGTALVLYGESSGRTFVGRALSIRPLVAVGLVSYALYLWHWPLLVFTHVFVIHRLTILETTLALAGACILAVVSRYAIEEPVRLGMVLPSRRAIFAVAGACTGAVLALAIVTETTGGFAARVPASAGASEAFVGGRVVDILRSQCIAPMKGGGAASRCDVGFKRRSVVSTMLLWGDSHASAYAPVLAEAAKKLRLRATVEWRRGCGALFGLMKATPGNRACLDLWTRVRGRVSRNQNYRTVLIAAHWGLWANGIGYDADPAGFIGLTDGKRVSTNADESAQMMAKALDETIAYFQKRHLQVVLIGPVPELAYDVPRALARIAWTGAPLDIRVTRTQHFTYQKRVIAMFQAARKHRGVHVVYPHEGLCRPKYCRVWSRSSVPYYLDGHHLAPSAKALLWRGLATVLAEIEPASPSPPPERSE